MAGCLGVTFSPGDATCREGIVHQSPLELRPFRPGDAAELHALPTIIVFGLIAD